MSRATASATRRGPDSPRSTPRVDRRPKRTVPGVVAEPVVLVLAGAMVTQASRGLDGAGVGVGSRVPGGDAAGVDQTWDRTGVGGGPGRAPPDAAAPPAAAPAAPPPAPPTTAVTERSTDWTPTRPWLATAMVEPLVARCHSPATWVPAKSRTLKQAHGASEARSRRISPDLSLIHI